MRSRVLAATLFALASAAILCAADAPSAPSLLFPSVTNIQPPEVAPPPKPKEMYVTTEDGQKFRVVNREQMRFKSVKKRFAVEGMTSVLKDVKDPPATFDFSGSGKFTSNVLGNNRWGDCFYVAPAHQSQCWLGMNGNPFAFDEAKLVARYKVLSHGDHGLSDEDILPEWRAGIIGPNGPHKILDVALIDPADWKSVKSATYRLGGCVTTHSLRTPWESNIKPGMLWDNTGRIDPSAGHAVQQCGATTISGKEVLVTATWGMQVYMTQAGLANSNAEVLVSVSTEWFNSRGYTPNGDHYNDVAKYWEAGTGHKLPQGLFPDPGPEPTPTPPVPPSPTPPAPPVPSGNVVIDPAAKAVTVPAGWTVLGGGGVPVPQPPGTTSPAVDFVKNHAAKKQARKDGAGLIVTKAELAAARAKIDAAVSDADVETMLKEKGAKIAGPLTDLLEWITSHTAELEALISLILKLVALFAVDLPAEPHPWCEVLFSLAA